MDFAASLSVVQTLFAAIRCAELMEVCTVLGKNSELDHFSNTVCDVKRLLLDTKARQDKLSHEARLWLEELKGAVYDADDLLDEFMTLAEQKPLIVDGQATEEVRLIFSRFHPLAVSDYMSRRVKKIRESLDVIVNDNDQCRINIDRLLPVRMRKEKNCSYVYADGDIIGREDDLMKILGMLLDSDVQQDVSVLSIVGVGGIGKTALARLVYNDERVTRAFPLRLWTCVSDQDQKELDVNEILGKIVRSAIGHNYNGSEMGLLDQLMEQIEGRKYLLVLDDVWTANRDQWLKLVEVLMAGKRGSRIVVTTRLRETAEALGADATYQLQGLSVESSWRLFEKMAFEESYPPDNLVRIGQEIVKGCHSNPLALRVVGSLLYGQDESKWLYFQDSGLAKIRGNMNDIKPILKLSYHHLESALQSCFCYCALFPKDFEIEKDLLISLWISQGFVVPFEEGQTTDYAGEEYFSTLLERCFFQDVQKDENGDIVSCKMHDLMHDVAQELAGEEITVVGSVIENLHKRVIHLSDAKGKSTEVNFSAMTQIRTYFQVDRMDKLPMDQLIDSCISLRTLVLRNSGIKNLPDSIDKLLHMRCIDLSDNSSLEVLPNSITNLHNLQSLRLRSCIHLKELPKDISKLAKLRVLDITYCYRLAYVPSDLHRLTCLHTLSNFTVSAATSSSKQCSEQLEGLKTLGNLKGHLWIKLWFPKNGAYVKEEGREGAFLKNKEHLKHVRFDIQHSQDDARDDYDAALLGDLQPHSNLKGIVFSGYSSRRLPSWAVEDNLSTFLPNLVRLEFVRCMKLVSLPWLGKLHHLKFLSIYDLPNLESVETNSASPEPGSSTVEVQTVFPCLEELSLSGLPKLIGWRKDVEETNDISEDISTRSRRKPRPKMKKSRQLPFFLCLPQLKSLQIRECLELTYTLLCPRLENLTLRVFNKKLSINVTTKRVDKKGVATTSSTSSPSLLTSDPETMKHPKLLSVITDNIAWLNTLPREAFHCLSHICIYWDKELESLSEVEEIFRSCSTSLRNLEICHCPRLTSLSRGLEYLTVLETLVLEYISNLRLTTSAEEERKLDGMPWRSLHQSLRSLELSSLPKILKLPKGMQYLTSLRSLKIYDCQELKFLPEWTQELSSLKQLEVQGCHHLCETYENLLG